jgi:hypothetical protein
VQEQHVQVVRAQRLQRVFCGGDDVFVGLVIAPGIIDDARLRLQRDLLPFGRAQLEGLGESTLAQVRAATGVVEAVEVGVIEEVDPRITGRGVKVADLLVSVAGDAHHACDDVRHPGAGGSEGDGLHGVLSWSGHDVGS